MAGFTTDVPLSTIVWTGITQGLGLGFIFVPLSTLTFATLAPHYRTEGTAMFSLMRNLGSSIGISAVVTLLAQNIQVNHADMAANATPFRATMQLPWLPSIWQWQTTAGVTALNGEITRQAATVAYLNDFIFMMWMTLLAAPLLLLLRKPPARRTA
jgi:DHA2 family multidrug resistance protein